ncbi:MAG: hypothetical protein ACXW4T_08910, partial [Candidatus Limnocylindrales bacterium]
LDPAWTPMPGARTDVVPARRLLGAVVERIDLYDEALALVDGWADRTAIADRLLAEDVTYWYRVRETMWRWTHERLLWRHVLAGLATDGVPIVDIEVPSAEAAILEVARRSWPAATLTVVPAVDATGSAASASTIPTSARSSRVRRIARAVLARTMSRVTPPPQPTERARREAILAERVVAMSDGPTARVLVLTNPSTHQRVGVGGGDRQDPLFGAVIPRLEASGLRPVLLATGVDQRRDEDWALLASDDRILPQQLLRTRWSQPDDDRRAEEAEATVRPAIDRVREVPLDLAGVDMGLDFSAALEAFAAPLIRRDLHTLARAERLFAELAPRAVVLAQEGIRTPWVVAARRAGVPLFAVQHGVLYPGHPGYPNVRHRSLSLPSRTFVFGEDEREVLLAGAYLPDEVEVMGSPRLDLDRPPNDPTAASDERRSVRAEFDVEDADRLLVVSTVNLRFVQRSHFVHMLEAVLGGPLPGVHVVFKQHPGEHDEGPYRDLLVGLARAGGFAAPPISVVKDTDLYRLLRAADAHLSLLSTVLTDAVATGTPNLIAMTDGHVDLLGYVAAGVATPVRTPRDVVEALSNLRVPDPAARAAFLAAHFRPGDASSRIVSAIVAAVAVAAGADLAPTQSATAVASPADAGVGDAP